MGRRLAIVSCAVLCGCLIPDLYPLSGGGGGGDAGSSGDAGDAGDSGTPDVIVTGDGSARYCDGFKNATFCDDFDVGTLGAGWLPPDLKGAGSTVAQSSTAQSLPFSLRSTITGPQSNDPVAYIEKDFPGTWVALDYSYYLYVVKRPTTTGMEIGDVGVFTSTEAWYAGLIVGGSTDQGFVEHDKPATPSQYAPTQLTAPTPVGKWVHVEWHVVLDPQPSATLKMDGAIVYDVQIPGNFGFAKGAIFVEAGIAFSDKSTNGGEVLVDGVVVRLTP